MSELKTKQTIESAEKFLETIEPESKRIESFTLLKMFQEITKEKPVMWGTSIIGFGMYHYKSTRSKQEGDWPLVAFSPRKTALTFYLMSTNNGYEELLSKLGKHKTSVGCLYINKLADIDLAILTLLIEKCFKNNTEQLKK